MINLGHTAHSPEATMTPEERVRIALDTHATFSVKKVAPLVGLSPQSVALIRQGKLYAKVLPELPRGSLNSRRCWQCALAARTQAVRRYYKSEEELPEPWCSLGYPESMDASYARECPAFIANQ